MAKIERALVVDSAELGKWLGLLVDAYKSAGTETLNTAQLFLQSFSGGQFGVSKYFDITCRHVDDPAADTCGLNATLVPLDPLRNLIAAVRADDAELARKIIGDGHTYSSVG